LTYDPQPLVELLNPGLSGILNRRVQEDDLVLDADLMNNGLEREPAFQELCEPASVMAMFQVRAVN
jgi:hypothetical protein